MGIRAGARDPQRVGSQGREAGPSEEDRAKAEEVAEQLRQSDMSPARGVLTPLPADQVLREWLEAHRGEGIGEKSCVYGILRLVEEHLDAVERLEQLASADAD